MSQVTLTIGTSYLGMYLNLLGGMFNQLFL